MKACLIFLFCITLTTQVTFAQDYAMVTKPAESYISNSVSPIKAKSTRLEPVLVAKRAQKMSAAYDGFAILVSTTELPLLSGDPLFRQFGNLQYDQNADGSYSYFILTPFHSKKSVNRFFKRVIKGKAPEASVVKYKKGKRKK
jgi:hypothetical protein